MVSYTRPGRIYLAMGSYSLYRSSRPLRKGRSGVMTSTDADHSPLKQRQSTLPLLRRKRPIRNAHVHACVSLLIMHSFFISQSDSHMTTKSDRSDWQSHDHKVRQVRLVVTRSLNLTEQTGSHTTTKSDRSDWQSHDHKVRQVTLVVTRSLNPDRSDWQSHDH